MAKQNGKVYKYHNGFGNHFCSEALPGTLPEGQNTPQKCPKGLYAEQLSGTAFTAPRASNQRTWFYRIRPSATHRPFEKLAKQNPLLVSDWSHSDVNPTQLRWDPFDIPSEPKDFVEGLITLAGAGDPSLKTGLAAHVYCCNKSMDRKAFYNSDGDLLIVPQQGALDIQTEFGWVYVPPGHIAVVQRGIRFSVNVDGPSRGYVLEVYQSHFRLPDLGPIGANGLANPRDFETPTAAFDADPLPAGQQFTIVNKFMGVLYGCAQDHSPFDVVAWHGNYAPYRYDLARFNTVNTVTFDHLDPSIFTVLTVPTNEPGTACADFVIFPWRWMVAERTFRPPYYHRNTASELMGLIRGDYDAKKGGFVPGGASLHNCMTPHGPDAKTFEEASNAKLEPQRYSENSLAFMFETTYMFKVTPFASSNKVQLDYYKCWQDLKSHFEK